jgi:hypothetical protein
MAKKKGQQDKKQSTKYYKENERLSNTNPIKNRTPDIVVLMRIFLIDG